MEASEKPQLPLDAGSRPIVRALDDRLVIESLTVNDDRAAQLVRDRLERGEDPARTVADAIGIGARVLDREDAAVEVDFVRREYERAVAEHRKESERQQREAVERIEAEIRRAFGDGRTPGLLSDALRRHQEEIDALIEETFGEGSEEAVPRKIQEQIERRNREFLERLSANDELNPLRPLLNQFSAWVKERREGQDERDANLERKLDEFLTRAAELVGLDRAREAVEEAEAAGTRKGFTFEDAVHGALAEIAAARGDVATHTGTEQAEGGGRKGDTLVEIGACDGPSRGRIVFEAKDKRLSRNAAWKELDEAMAARAAAFGVLVVAGHENVPAGSQELTEYEGNKMIVAVDREEPGGLALGVAYRLAAARVALARDGKLTLDGPAVRAAAEEALSTLRQAQSIRSTLTSIKTSSDRARSGLDAMVAAVESKLELIDSLVSDADEDTRDDAGA